MDFLDYYRNNLAYLRGLAVEFAAEFPKIAERLDIQEFECQDPYVERLLEGTAFLSARVEKKLDESYVRLLESVLNSLAPGVTAPIPSGAVLELSLDSGNEKVLQGAVLEKGSFYDAFIPTINSPCRWSTFMDVPISAVGVSGAEYVTRNLSAFGIGEDEAAAGLHLSLSCIAQSPLVLPRELLFYINLQDDIASLLLRQILVDRTAVYVSQDGKTYQPWEGLSFELPLGVDTDTVDGGFRGNIRGLMLLQEFLSYPAFFKFFTMKPGKLPAFSKKAFQTIDILILFQSREPTLSNEIKTGALKLNCVPVLNLFPKRSDRITLEKQAYEYHIVPERTAMRDYEVVNILRLEFYNEQNETLFKAAGFYDYDVARPEAPKEKSETVLHNFFSTHRRKHLFSSKARRRSSYDGTEVFVSFSGGEQNLDRAYQFIAELICTNRDMPLLFPSQVSLASPGELAPSGVFLSRPTRPGYSLIERGDKTDFAKLSHILYNLSGLLWQEGEFPLKMFKTMLRNYRLRQDEEINRMIDGILHIEGKPETFRFISRGAVYFERGWKITLTLDESAYAGIGSYLFAFVLREVLRSFTPINSMLEVQFFTRQSGFVTSWKT